MKPDVLIKQLQAQRETWCELEPAEGGRPALRVLIRRPSETELPKLYGGVSIAAVQACVVGWEGMSTERLLGAAVGSADALAFDAALWAEIASDRAAWSEACAAHLVGQITAHLDAKAKLQGNSKPSSTQAQA
ncbi:hypothetical protein SNE35_28645 [Paucibacter sp. R3-3]|uniref:Uncharacterized protein n=1 Tax=Roseateles agri TaxID=3098619 RepID=A0ABU5DRY3_9BURK|nr:hypothetical protein [Paucibacter sp. R3-3]MDY0748503.1 hypothetical protein [Paucibacter sp. R3-3]